MTEPPAAPPPRPVGPSGSAAPSRRDAILLIVDDEPGVLEGLRHLFRRDYRVLTAPDGEAGLVILAQEPVRVILSDQRMPGLRGDAFLARARLVRPEAIRLLFTGYADLQAVINAVNDGQIYRYLTKPWEPSELQAIIRQAFDQFDLLEERRRLLVELHEANDRLTRANLDLATSVALKSTFLEVASHEFNTPITLVQGLSELLRLLDPDRPEAESEVVEQIAAGARRLGKLVASTLQLLEADDPGQVLRLETVDLAPWLAEVAESVRPFVRARGQFLRVEIQQGLGTFAIDPAKVRDAVINLLTNAIKFTPDGGSLSLEAEVRGDGAEVRVVDQGVGIAPADLSHLFTPFFTQLDPSRHSSGDLGFQKRGLGLGLSLTRRFVEMHGGLVGAESRPGQGTRMTILLPRRGFPLAPLPGRIPRRDRRRGVGDPLGDGPTRPLTSRTPPRRAAGPLDADRPDRRGRTRGQQAAGDGGPVAGLSDRVGLHRRRGPGQGGAAPSGRRPVGPDAAGH